MEKGSVGRFKLDYKWVVVGICFITVLIGLGFCSSPRGIFVLPICEALGISRSVYSISDSVRYITTAVINMFFGFLIYRLGAKLLMSMGIVSLILSMLICSFADNIVLLCIGTAFLGIGLSWTTTTMVGAVINRWCKEHKGTIMGFILASNGIGATIAINVLTPIIHEEGNPFGYRNAYLLVALILVFVLALVLIFFRNKPKGEAEEETAERVEKKPAERSKEFALTLKKPFFYIASFCIFVSGMILQSVYGIATPLYGDAGIDEAVVAVILSVSSIILSVSKFGIGFIYDRFGLRVTTAICFSCSMISMAMLLIVSNTGSVLCAYLYSIVSSIALPLETVMLPIYARELFGEKCFNEALGIFASVNTAGYAVGAPLGNLCFDLTGSYDVALYIGCGIMFVAMFAIQYVITKAYKYKKEKSVA